MDSTIRRGQGQDCIFQLNILGNCCWFVGLRCFAPRGPQLPLQTTAVGVPRLFQAHDQIRHSHGRQLGQRARQSFDGDRKQMERIEQGRQSTLLFTIRRLETQLGSSIRSDLGVQDVPQTNLETKTRFKKEQILLPVGKSVQTCFFLFVVVVVVLRHAQHTPLVDPRDGTPTTMGHSSSHRSVGGEGVWNVSFAGRGTHVSHHMDVRLRVEFHSY